MLHSFAHGNALPDRARLLLALSLPKLLSQRRLAGARALLRRGTRVRPRPGWCPAREAPPAHRARGGVDPTPDADAGQTPGSVGGAALFVPPSEHFPPPRGCERGSVRARPTIYAM
ncbi:hypothetical protein FB451DRAFT_1187446 [Mycena latifolia]|nr:hypothetical protein FB451DRAFT_1187446 [Mycena latifolia]